MKWSFATIGVTILGLIGIAIILLFQSLTTNNENDYYLLKEVTEASMFDAIDYKVYRETGELRIREKVFVESFTRRFAESTLFMGSSYTIKMFDIMESPPKVTIMIDTGIGSYTIYKDTSDYNVVNSLSAILEYNNFDFYNIGEDSIFYDESSNYFSGINNGYISKSYEGDYYSFIGVKSNNVDFNQVLKIPDILNVRGGLIKVNSVEIIDGPNVIDDNLFENVSMAFLKREVDWVTGKSSYFDMNYYDIGRYYTGNLNISKIDDIYLCNSNVDSRCNGVNTFIFKWRGTINNSENKILFVKYKIRWNYDIFV